MTFWLSNWKRKSFFSRFFLPFHIGNWMGWKSFLKLFSYNLFSFFWGQLKAEGSGLDLQFVVSVEWGISVDDWLLIKFYEKKHFDRYLVIYVEINKKIKIIFKDYQTHSNFIAKWEKYKTLWTKQISHGNKYSL